MKLLSLRITILGFFFFFHGCGVYYSDGVCFVHWRFVTKSQSLKRKQDCMHGNWGNLQRKLQIIIDFESNSTQETKKKY